MTEQKTNPEELPKSRKLNFLDTAQAQAYYDESYLTWEHEDEVLANWEQLVELGATVDIDSYVARQIRDEEGEPYEEDAEGYGWILRNLDRLRALNPTLPLLTDPEVLKAEIFKKGYACIFLEDMRYEGLKPVFCDSLDAAVRFGINPQEIADDILAHDDEPYMLLEEVILRQFEGYGVTIDPAAVHAAEEAIEAERAVREQQESGDASQG